ncbi:hypothetical protein ACMFMG_003554 [Clarireedia jacksonii]
MFSSSSSNSSTHRSNPKPFDCDHDQYPVVYPTPIKSLQDSLLNTPVDFIPQVRKGRPHSDNLNNSTDRISFAESTLRHPAEITNINLPFPATIDPALTLSSNDPYTDIASAKPRRRAVKRIKDRGRPLHSAAVRLTSPSISPTCKPLFGNTRKTYDMQSRSIDSMRSQAFLPPGSLFCCPAITILENPPRNYEHALRKFVHHFSPQICANSLYAGHPECLPPQSSDPDFRIPMLLLSGAWIYKVAKVGDYEGVKYFVEDVNGDKKYREILPGDLVHQIGWQGQLISAAEHNVSGKWICRAHKNVWFISVLDNTFDDGTSSSGTSMSTTRAGSVASIVTTGSRKGSFTIQGGIQKPHRKKSSSSTSSVSEITNFAAATSSNLDRLIEEGLIKTKVIADPPAHFDQNDITATHQPLKSHDCMFGENLDINLEGFFDVLGNEISAFDAANPDYEIAAADYGFANL